MSATSAIQAIKINACFAAELILSFFPFLPLLQSVAMCNSVDKSQEVCLVGGYNFLHASGVIIDETKKKRWKTGKERQLIYSGRKCGSLLGNENQSRACSLI